MCRWRIETGVRWLPWTRDCFTIRCKCPTVVSNPAKYFNPATVRYATEGDAIIPKKMGCNCKGELRFPKRIDNADYVLVRSCACNKNECPHFEHIETENHQ